MKKNLYKHNVMQIPKIKILQRPMHQKIKINPVNIATQDTNK